MSRLKLKNLGWILLLAAPALSACQTMSGAPPQPFSVLDEDSASLRRNLVILDQSMARVPNYAPVNSCQYRNSNLYSDRALGEDFTLRVARVRSSSGRLLITYGAPGRLSTAVIGVDGRMFDFNIAGTDGARWTPDTFGQRARAAAARNGTQGEEITPLTVAFPRYVQTSWQPGSTVATILSEDGATWARMLFRGTTNINGRVVAVLDIIKERPQVTQDIGYSLVDVTNLLPVLLVLRQNNNLWRLEQQSCS